MNQTDIPSQSKQEYVRRIRASSVYPTFRSLIGVFVWLLYILGGLIALLGLIGGLATIFNKDSMAGTGGVIGGPIVGLIYIVIGKFIKEASLMVADIADSLLDLNSRSDRQP